MIQTNYPIRAMGILLARDCVMERFYPLIPLKEPLIAGLLRLGCETKNDAAALSDAELAQIGLPADVMGLFRRFLTLYDIKPQKLREIEKITSDPAERAAFRELYHLPGVQRTRAELYYRSGYTSLRSLADATVEEVTERTAQTVATVCPTDTVPFPKEIRTHIAVSRAFTLEN